MDLKNLSRRDFARWTAVAVGGVVAGATVIGCGQGSGGVSSASAGEMHACKGLNGCKGEGADGKNACAGQGGCASKATHHECKGHNACKGQGGCGENPGANACKGQGGCAVPIKEEAGWKKAREAFEKKMKAQGKTAGPAPK
jgi:hypothetical protein